MKTLKAIDTKIEPFDPLQTDPSLMPSIRYIIKAQLTGSKPKSYEESAMMGQILKKLKLAQPDIEVQDTEFKIIVDKFNENESKLVGGWHIPVCDMLSQCEKGSAA